jgi:5-(carboxyamino)imidazole ribonucleotide synthase
MPDPETPPPPSARIGIIGGGQLARMLYEASIPLALETTVLAPAPNSAAALAGAADIIGEPTDANALGELARRCEVITFDHELVDLDRLVALGPDTKIEPPPAAKRLAQDKLLARQELSAAGIPVPAFEVAPDLATVEVFAARHGWPVVLKARKGSYNGQGVWFAADSVQASEILARARVSRSNLFVEPFVSVSREISMIIARRSSGHACGFPLIETRQEEGVCVETVVPARVSDAVQAEAQDIAHRVARIAAHTGLLVVEMFVSETDVLVNELAFRPHNSGHITIEACATSQFEQHLRGILDWPLGPTQLVVPAAAMVNLFGNASTERGFARTLPQALEIEGCSIHLYAKPSWPGRKLGHVTAVGPSAETSLAHARSAVAILSSAA